MPLISLITPVYNPPAEALQETIASVRSQDFADWEWCLCDDASTDSAVVAMLAELAATDARIKLVTSADNRGIVAASNAALEVATAEFVALLDHDDSLAPGALRTVAEYLARFPQADYLYSDEDKLAPDGGHYDLFRKPEWSPERLRSHMYTGHLSVLRREVVMSVGGFRPGFDGSQDHDLVLRVTEKSRQVVHIPHVLYHWRVVPGSAAGDAEAKPYAFEAGRRAVADHCRRVGIKATVEQYPGMSLFRVRRRVEDNPLVSIVVPTRGSAGKVWGEDRVFVVEALRSVVAVSSYRNIEFVVVYDSDTPSSVLAELGGICGDAFVPVRFDQPFNFSAKINLGYTHSSGEYLLLLNDDVEVIDPDWIETLLALAQEPGVGTVGAKLLFSDGTLQHGGHHYDNGEMYHIHYGAEPQDPGYFASLLAQREASGVTGACMMVPREVFEHVGGLAPGLPVNFNDVDFCLKVRQAGYRIIWTPWARLYHFESKTRDAVVTEEEVTFIRARWGFDAAWDPYLASL